MKNGNVANAAGVSFYETFAIAASFQLPGIVRGRRERDNQEVEQMFECRSDAQRVLMGFQIPLGSPVRKSAA
jgi:hypothetical protein